MNASTPMPSNPVRARLLAGGNAFGVMAFDFFTPGLAPVLAEAGAEPELLGPRVAEVEATIGVAQASMEVLGRNGELALEGAAALDWEAAPLRRNAPGCRGACWHVAGPGLPSRWPRGRWLPLEGQ